MSECNFWWRTGDIQWCDMKEFECHCGGWDENCDLKLSGRNMIARLQEQAATTQQKARRKRLKGAA